MTPKCKRLTAVFLLAGLGALSPLYSQSAKQQVTRLPDGVFLWKSSPDGGDRPAFWTFFERLLNAILPPRSALPFGRSVAFLVGVSNYRHLTPLPFVRNDLEDLRTYLIEKGGFDEVYVASEGVVSRHLIEDYMMNKFPAWLGTKDRLLFYYSGHGADAGGTTGYLQFSDAQPGNFAQGVLAVSEVREWAEVNHAAHVLFLLDACSSGLGVTPRAGSTAEDETHLIETLSGLGSRAVVSAGTAGEQTFEVRSAGHGNGVFTRAFLSALEKGIGQKTAPAFLTLDQVVADVQVSVAKFAAEFKKPLHPRMWTLDDETYRGSFLFLNPAVRTASVPANQLIQLGVQRGALPVPSPAAGTTANPSDDIALQAQEAIRAGSLEEAIEGFKKACEGGSVRGCAGIDLYYLGLGGYFVNSRMAVELYRKKCNGGDAEACTMLGHAYELGWGELAADNKMAFELYRQACDGGSGNGCTNLAAYYDLSGDPKTGAELDRKAIEMFRKTCDSGSAGSCGALGFAYQNGKDGLVADPKLAKDLFRKACNGGHADGCFRLGELETDPKIASELYQKACDMGDGLVCRDLGTAYLRGHHFWTRSNLKFRPDQKTAVDFYRRACENGNGFTCLDLGVAYHDGNVELGLAVDKTIAVQLFQAACNGRVDEGCIRLALAYDKGEGGLTTDPALAVDLFGKTCKRSGGEGCRRLGEAYRDGSGGLTPDDSLAVSLFRKACKGHDGQACTDLGDAYRNGKLGLAVDLKQAIDFYKEACEVQGARCRDLAVAYEKGLLGLKPDRKTASNLYARACDGGDSESCAKNSHKTAKK